MPGHTRRTFLPLLIVALLTGCDNVEWGGAEFHLEPPPARVSEAPDSTSTSAAESDEAPLPDLPEYPVLFMGTREGARATLVPVAELTPAGPVALTTEGDAPGFNAHWVDTRFPPGSELTLFAAGTRVGTLVVDGVESAGNWCEERLSVSGVAELAPQGSPPTRLIALSGTGEARFPHGRSRTTTDSYEQRVAGLNLANVAIAQTGAPWPPSVLETRQDMQAFHLHPDSTAAIAATFAYQDALSVGAPEGPNAYSLFVLGEGGPVDYRLAYTWYRPASAGKAVPRYFQHADWDGDGASEIVLEVFSSEGRGAVLLEHGENGWQETFELSCSATGG